MSENNFLLKSKKAADTRYKKALKKEYVYKKIVNKWYFSEDYYFGEVSTYQSQDERKARKELRAAKLYKHPKVCSCAACGNPRNNGWSNGLTLKEIAMKDRRHPDAENNWYSE